MNAIVIWLIIIMFVCFVPYLLGKLDLFDLNIRDDIAFLVWIKGSLILGIITAVVLIVYFTLILILNRKN